jgi:hypothetical protein
MNRTESVGTKSVAASRSLHRMIGRNAGGACDEAGAGDADNETGARREGGYDA